MPDSKTVRPRGGLHIRVRPPGSKSITNRALLIAALAPGRSVIRDPLLSDDTHAMSQGLRSLGVTVTPEPGGLVVDGGRLGQAEGALDVNLSGTSLRFLVAAAAAADGINVIDGRQRIRERPIRALVDALNDMGVQADVDPVTGGAPVVVTGGSLAGGSIVMDGRGSSQPVSALMMIAPLAKSATRVRFVEDVIVSRSYLVTTAEVMEAFGVTAAVLDASIEISPASYQPTDFAVEADASAAVYPWCAAAISTGTATTTGISGESTQSDMVVLDALEAMGCKITRDAESITVSARSRLRGINMDLSGCPDGAMAVAVCAAFATGRSTLHGLSTWALKETDRLTAVATELAKLGVKVGVTSDSLAIDPPDTLQPARIDTYDDHRMAMAFSLAGLGADGVEINDPMVVTKTWPDYWDEFESWR